MTLNSVMLAAIPSASERTATKENARCFYTCRSAKRMSWRRIDTMPRLRGNQTARLIFLSIEAAVCGAFTGLAIARRSSDCAAAGSVACNVVRIPVFSSSSRIPHCELNFDVLCPPLTISTAFICRGLFQASARPLFARGAYGNRRREAKSGQLFRRSMPPSAVCRELFPSVKQAA